MKRLKVLACAVALLAPVVSRPSLHAQVAFPGPELLGRPTDNSVTVNVVASMAIEAYFEYGTAPGAYAQQTTIIAAAANEPLVAVLDGLSPDTRYFYRMLYRPAGTGSWIARDEHSFHTQRSPGSAFTFTITADSHVNIVFGDTSLYQQTLSNVNADGPDFHLDLGDTFAMDNVTTQAQARNAYLSQRPLMGLFSHSAPVFLALGNHEQEEGWHRDDTGNLATSRPILGANARKRYFLNPVPDSFYSGNGDAWPALTGDGLPGDYYAWRWGDALFIVIDPYWYTTVKPFIGNTGGGENSDTGTGDRWEWTLGFEQYQWLKQTLESSDASLKFIFAHHGTGGTDDYIRGGANAVPFTEWGGRDEDGVTYSFESRRPGWQAPIHQLLVDNHVSAFFHAHDHMFAHEERDGVVYQLVPMAADTNYGFGFQNYRETDPFTIRVLPNSGHLRVTVSGQSAAVDYVRAFLPGDGNNGQVPYSYTISGVDPGTPPVPPGNPPTNPPGAASVSAVLTTGGRVTTTWSGIGTPSATDWLALFATGSDDSQYLRWFYTSCSTAPASPAATGSCTFDLPDGLPDGTYDVRLFANNDWVRLASSVSFVVSRSSPPPPPGGQAILTSSPSVIQSGGQVTAAWSGVSSPSPTDWIALSVPGAPDDHYISWIYTSCSTAAGAARASGTCPFTLPGLSSGTYELRLFANDGFSRLATGPAFVVGGMPGGEPGGGGVTLSTSPASVRVGDVVAVSWGGISAPSATDWIALFVPGATDAEYLAWSFTSCSTTPGAPAVSGSCQFEVPSWISPGPYEFRLLSNNDYVRLATGPAFVVAP